MPNSELKYWLAFSRLPQIGPARFKKIYTYFPTMEQAYFAPMSEWQKVGLDEKITRAFFDLKNKINLEHDWEYLQREQIQIITIKNPAYPSLLKQIANPPALLFVKGNLNNINYQYNLAVVGSRKFTNYGQEAAYQIVGDLVKNKIAIVSGLALGIDALAHQAALKNQGQTIAVLGAGVDRSSIYPRANFYLAEQILKNNGTLISEYPPQSWPQKQNFPLRNRIIAGLCLGTLVIEAGARSGSLITAFLALEQNREVFAIPGSIFNELSAGTNMLIKKGAKVVTQANDILEELNLSPIEHYVKNQNTIAATAEEKIILDLLNEHALHIDQIVKLTNLSADQIASTLMIMLLKGQVRNLGGQIYRKL